MEPVEVEGVKKKKKRPYNRAPVKVTVDGKLYRGLKLREEGAFFVLTTAKGSVYINKLLAKRPIEIVGEIVVAAAPAPVPNWPIVGPAVAQTGPVISGGAVTLNPSSRFAQKRQAELEGLLKMPEGLDVEG
jgi:hypothetical protein